MNHLAALVETALTAGSLLALPLALLGGILTGLNPCCLPLYPAVAATCCAARGEKPKMAFRTAFAFIVGAALTTTVLGVLAAAAGRSVTALGGWPRYLIALVPLVVAVHLLGWVRIPMPRVARPGSGQAGGAFLAGLLLSLTVTPCGTPVLAAVFLTPLSGAASPTGRRSSSSSGSAPACRCSWLGRARLASPSGSTPAVGAPGSIAARRAFSLRWVSTFSGQRDAMRSAQHHRLPHGANSSLAVPAGIRTNEPHGMQDGPQGRDHMKKFELTVTSDKKFEDAVAAVEQKAAEKGFRVLHTHDVAATLAEKGFPCEPLKILEICNARYASQVLARDVKISLMLPCPISVYLAGGKTHISTMLPTAIIEFFPQAGIEELAWAVEQNVVEIVEQAR